MKNKSLFLILLLAVFAPWAAKAQETQTITCYAANQQYATGYTSTTEKTSGDMHTEGNSGVQGWIKFDVSSIPDNAIINSITLKFYCIGQNNCWVRLTSAGELDPATASASALYSAITNDDPNYFTSDYMSSFTVNSWKTVTLSDAAKTNLQSHGLTNNYFTVGFHEYETGSTTYYLYAAGYEDDNKPYIEVNYTIPASCPKPTDFHCALYTTTTATLTWTEAGEANQWELWYGTDPTFASHQTKTAGFTVTGTTVTAELPGLTADVTHYAQVKAICDPGVDESSWVTCEFTPSAEMIVPISGTANTAYYLPTNTNYDYSYTQQIYTAAEIGGFAGEIKSISFKGNRDHTRNLDVYMMNTDKAAFDSKTDVFDISQATLVYSDNFTFTADDWSTITLSPRFEYEGANLVVIVDDNTGSDPGLTTWQTFNATNQALCYYQDDTNINPSSPSASNNSLQSSKNQLQLVIIPDLTPKPKNVEVSNITNESATVTWQAPASATPTGYQYQYKYATTPTWPDTWNSLAANVTEKTLILEASKTYDFRIRANYSEGDSDPVEIQFTTLDACAVPNMLEPYVRLGAGTEATVIWNPGYDENNWVLQYATNADFSEGLQEITSGFVSQTIEEVTYIQRPLTSLTAEQTYYARVKADCDGPTSNWSDVVSFTPTYYMNYTYNADAYSTSSYNGVPFHGKYVAYATHSQFIIPATSLTEIAGATVRELTFYSSTATADWGSVTYKIYVKEVDNTTFASAPSAFDWSGMTQVYSGSLSIANNQMVINLDTPFIYGGSNLLIGFEETATGTNVDCSWIYNSVSNSCIYGYKSSESGTLGIYTGNYSPKLTFNYLPTPYKYPVIDEENCTFGATSAHIAWTVTDATPTGYAYQFKPVSETEWPSGWNTISFSYVDLPSSQLRPATFYDFRVKALYEGGNESIKVNYSFHTECPEYYTITQEDDFTQNFDDVAGVTSGTTNNLPLCWNYLNTSTNSSYQGYPVVYNDNSASKSAPNYLRFYSYYGSSSSGAADQYAILPPMANVNGLRMKLYARANSTSSTYNATFHVGVMTDPADASTFVEIGEGYTPAAATYEQFTIPFNSYTGEGQYIAIMIKAAEAFGGYTYGYRSVFIDDITVELIPACNYEVEGLAVDKSSITNESVTVNWTAGDPGAWQVATKAGDGAWTTLPTTYTTNSAPLSGLTAGTAYQVKVRAYCNANEQGSWCDPVSFTTYCNPQPITGDDAYEENFNSYTGCATSATPLSTYPNDELPDCWRFLNRSESSSTYPMVFLSSHSSYATSGNCLFFKSSNTTPIYAILPAFENATSALQLTFKYRNESTYDSNGTLYVGYMTNPNDATTFQVKYTCPITTTITPVGPIYFADAPANSYIAFRYTGGTSNNMYLGIDDVVVSLAPTCWQPQNLAASNVTNESAVLTWEKHSMGTETAWVLQYGTDNTFATCTEKNVETNPTYTIESGLTAETTYFARVKPACDTEGNLWSEVLVFETEPDCAAPTNLAVTPGSETSVGATLTWNGRNDSFVVEYGVYDYTATPTIVTEVDNEGFENGIPTGWTHIGSGSIEIHTASTWSNHAHEGSKSLKFAGATANNVVVLPQFAEEVNTMTVSFWSQAEGSSSGEFDLGYVTDATDASTFHKVHTRKYSDDGTTYTEVPNISMADAPDGARIAFRHRSGAENWYWFIDEVTIVSTVYPLTWTVDGTALNVNNTGEYTFEDLDENTPYLARVKGVCGSVDSDYSDMVSFTTLESCPAPTNFVLGEVTASTAAFSWTQTGGITTWNIWVKESTDAEYPTDYITASNTPSLIIDEDLTANTTYDVKIAPACDHDKYLEVLEAFTTLCDPETITVTEPFTEDFEDWTTETYQYDNTHGIYPDCWDSNSEGSVYPHIINSGSYVYKHSGSYTMYFMGEASTNSYLALPVFTNDLSTLMVSFWMQTENENTDSGTTDYGTLSLGYITDADVDYNTYQVIETYANHKNNMVQRHTFLGDHSIPSNATRLVFRWQYGSTSWYGACIDDVRVAIAETFTKDITGYGNNEGGYVLLASPLADETDPVGVGMITDELGSEATIETASYDLYWFNQSQDDEWRNYRQSTFKLENGKGYLYANKEDVTLTFRGARYTGDGVIALTYVSNKEFSGVNLVGNPFATTATPSQPYYRLNPAGNGMNTQAYTETDAVNPMEGIFVMASGAEESVTFAPQTGGAKGGQLNLNLSQGNNLVDNAIVRFDGGSTLEKFSFRQGSTKVFITENDKDYAVVSAGHVGEIPVSFKAEKNGSYNLSFTAQEVSFSYLHLIDNLTGNDVNLLETPSYSFDARYTDYAQRFRLVFATGSSVDGDSFSFINASGNLCIFGIEGEATVQIVDALGRVLSSETFSGSYEKKIEGAPGVYLIRLINGDDVRVQKMVVR